MVKQQHISEKYVKFPDRVMDCRRQAIIDFRGILYDIFLKTAAPPRILSTPEYHPPITIQYFTVL